MRIELDNYSKEVLERVENEMGTDYGRKGNYVKIESLIAAIEGLEYEVHRLEEKIEDKEQDIEDNYRQIPVWQQIGVCKYDR